MARRVHRAKSFSYDLLADWRPYAEPPTQPRWIYHGTVTLEGETGALAWRHGWYGIAVGDQPVRELGLWERIKLSEDIRDQCVPGWNTVPTWPEVHPTPAIGWTQGPPSLWPDKAGK
jgi:hypothetical protein